MSLPSEDQLVQMYQDKIKNISNGFIRKYNIKSFEATDIEQELYLTLLRSARKFDPTKHTQFNTFFIRSVRSTLADLQKYCGQRFKLHNYAEINEAIKTHGERSLQKVSPSMSFIKPKQFHTLTFKIQLVRKLVSGASASKISKEFGISTSQLRLWQKQLRELAVRMKAGENIYG